MTDHRPSTAYAHSSPYTNKVQSQHLQKSVGSSADMSLAELRERLPSANKLTGKKTTPFSVM